MILGIDIDGPLYPFPAAMGRCFAEYTGTDPALYADDSTYDLWRGWGVPEQLFLESFAHGIKHGDVFLSQPPRPGSVEALSAARDLGWQIWLITARFLPGLEDKCHHDSLRWITEHQLPHDRLLMRTHKGVPGVDRMIDDRTQHLAEIEQVGGVGWLWRTNHNRSQAWPTSRQMTAWDQIYRVLA